MYGISLVENLYERFVVNINVAMASVLIIRSIFGSSCVSEVLRSKSSSNLGMVFNRLIWNDCPKLAKREGRIWKEDVPKPGNGRTFRRIVHYPEKYTVEPLNVTNLAGRDPVTGKFACLIKFQKRLQFDAFLSRMFKPDTFAIF